MSPDPFSKELASVAEEVRQHTLYLQELGLESFQGVPQLVKPDAIPPERVLVKQTNPAPRVSLSESPDRAPSYRRTPAPQPKASTLLGNMFPVPAEKLPQSLESFAQIHADVGDCTRCALCEGRKNIVHTEGNRKARLMFVGEAPGADEDEQSRPFVGRAGQLLTKIIEAIGFKREDVMIANINRCRPPGNRAPVPDEVAACKPFLLREIASARPDVIVVLGNTAMKNLLEIKEGITRVRGNFQDYKGIKVMPTFHPAYLLRDPSKKRETWEDLKKVRAYLDANKVSRTIES